MNDQGEANEPGKKSIKKPKKKELEIPKEAPGYSSEPPHDYLKKSSVYTSEVPPDFFERSPGYGFVASSNYFKNPIEQAQYNRELPFIRNGVFAGDLSFGQTIVNEAEKRVGSFSSPNIIPTGYSSNILYVNDERRFYVDPVIARVPTKPSTSISDSEEKIFKLKQQLQALKKQEQDAKTLQTQKDILISNLETQQKFQNIITRIGDFAHDKFSKSERFRKEFADERAISSVVIVPNRLNPWTSL